jgi:hypothetical protein
MGRGPIDETGNKYGKLTVIERVGDGKGRRSWRVRCDCGDEPTKPIRGYVLRANQRLHCGECSAPEEVPTKDAAASPWPGTSICYVSVPVDLHNPQKVGGFGMISWDERPVAMTDWVNGDLKRGHVSPVLLKVLLDFAHMGLIMADPVACELERWRKANSQCIHRLPLHTEHDSALAMRMYNRRRALVDADPFMQIVRAINSSGSI